MNKGYKRVLVWIAGIALCIFLVLYASNLVGWYGHKKWRYRTATSSIEESKERNVFVKEVNFRVERSTKPVSGFTPYIEKGFKFGVHSSKDTRLLSETRYPYQLSFNYLLSDERHVSIRNDQLSKFDSANASWGYLAEPYLKDTIILEIRSQRDSGIIKVW